MTTHFAIYWDLIKASIQARMEYRWNFFIFIVTLLFLYAAQIITVSVIVNRFKTIGGWSLGEVVFLYSILILVGGIVSSVFTGVLEFGSLVRLGGFDRYLIRPISPLGQVICMGFDVSGIAHLSLGTFTFIYANKLVDIHWGVINIVLLICSLIGGVMIMGGIRILIASVAFFSINNQSLVHLFIFSAREFLLYPASIYTRGVQFSLSFLFPIAFVNFYPAAYFLNKDTGLHPLFGLGTLPIGIAVFSIAMYFWRKGIKAYESAGGA
ncbi:ABC transporter permease [Leptospira sp. GIMC2001]|uniref:ABC transporter permease n=1 Tax=Leptospira sp. GIMC2001 TaxID=1513297 RepID=UPI00234A742F|nr:ABC-2 family transporter protein [Leptospira sp. GIMC2001]WCL50352.1 ABC-2 family transporter protein [Leptospira sp. GIMC2001]